MKAESQNGVIPQSIIPLDSRGRRDWKALGDGTLIAHARWRLADSGISERKKLEKADEGLYTVLRKRKLLDESGLEKKRRGWARMQNEELVAVAKKFIAEMGISGRSELAKTDAGLHFALKNRKLLGEVGLLQKRRDWDRMADETLVAFSKGFISDRGITGRTEFQEADGGLYMTLLKRKLLDAVFSDIDSSKQAEAVRSVIEALGSFGDGK